MLCVRAYQARKDDDVAGAGSEWIQVQSISFPSQASRSSRSAKAPDAGNTVFRDTRKYCVVYFSRLCAGRTV